MNSVAAVVVTYNRSALLLENITCLLAQSVPVDILIIDNNSTDDTREKLEPLIGDKKITYVNTGSTSAARAAFSTE